MDHDQDWVVRYMLVDTRDWLPGRKVIVSPQWIERMNWAESAVHVALSREAIQSSPEYDSEAPPAREYEVLLYRYYGFPGYWV